MKKFAAFASVFMLSQIAVSVASAAPTVSKDERQVVEVLRCRTVQYGADYGQLVRIASRNIGPGDVQEFFAELNENTAFGYRLQGRWAVVPQTERRIGGSTRYVGRDFVLEVNFTTTPNRDGSHRGHLVAEVNGQRVSEEMNCVRAH